jgi:hypothetical protein
MSSLKEAPRDEIDLTPIAIKLNKGVKLFINNTKKIAFVVVKKIKTIALFTGIGAFIGILFLFILPSVYRAEMLLNSNFLSNEYTFRNIKTLNDLIKEDNHRELANKLGMSLENVKKIKAINYLNFRPNFDPFKKDTIALSSPFRIEFLLRDNSGIDSIQFSLLNYLDQLEYSKTRKDIKQKSLLQLSLRIESELTQVDSLKSVVKQSIVNSRSGNGIILGQPLNPVDVHKDAIALYEKDLQISSELALLKNFEIIDGITKFQKPYRPKLWINLLVGITLGFIMGLIFIFYQENKKPSTSK